MTLNKLIKQVARKIADAASPVSFSGAGLSAESGIATFRDRDDEGALWSKFDPQKLASQEGFLADPEMVMDWYRMDFLWRSVLRFASARVMDFDMYIMKGAL